jgi:uncharacterized protein (TIGR02246 family)
MRARLTLALLAAAACQPPPSVLTDADRAAIDAQRAAFRDAMRAADWATAAGVYTEDATVMPANAPAVAGRANIQQMFQAMPPVGEIVFATREATGTAEVALVRGSFSMTMMLPGATVATADTGKFVELWRKQADGTWLLQWDIWNSDLAPPGAPPAGGAEHQH